MEKVSLSDGLVERLRKHKLVAAVKDPKNLEKAIKYKDHISAVLLMTGTILNVKRYVDFIQSHGLPVILHVERVGGLQMDKNGIDFVKKHIKPAAIVTTKSGIIKKAKASGIFVIQRVFLIDTDMYTNLEKGIEQNQSDIIEIMPSRVPEFINKLSKVSHVPIITGGLLSSVEHAKNALDNGAIAVSTSNIEVWKNDINHFI
ncbi:glycerol-3-phosphate responsive antiterminator [Oceanobacillus saliphilus]|uniref:glycerol-3-phosphate responsive antiterminator n=1 Tax=Oceanobacillus saliphilus TaxID=2925834 RepID=UPI00201D760C|nr:glycerol-3-phosphate responsive antiterminator [Oceanobacillus saliphilus]